MRKLLPLLLLMFAPLGQAQSVAQARCESGLELRLQAHERSVSARGALAFAVELRNSGSEPRWLYGDIGPGVQLTIVDSKGRSIVPRALFDLAPPPARRDDFLKLRPHHSLVLNDSYEVDGQLGLAPGSYRIRVALKLVGAHKSLGISACAGRLESAEELAILVLP